MRLASIDLGTNTILLLVADVTGASIDRIVHDEQVIARIGQGVDEHRMINQETFLRALQFLQRYHATCRELGVMKIFAVGTSALRDAVNRNEFCDFIRTETGTPVEILSGEEEAEWTYHGAVSEFIGSADTFTVLDIGGGSTEVISGDGISIRQKWSLDMGSVRVTERFFPQVPPTSLQVAEARAFIRGLLKNLDTSLLSSSLIIGVAGTLTTLASLYQQLPAYDPKKVSGYVLRYDDVHQLFNKLRIKRIEEIRAMPQISEGRADIILAGTFILLEFMEAAGLTSITVSDRGLRYGIVLREIGRGQAA